MKCFDVKESSVSQGIPVAQTPYPHIVLGEGGNKRSTWISLGKRDAGVIVKETKKPCPMRGQKRGDILVGETLPKCKECGAQYVQKGNAAEHPMDGFGLYPVKRDTFLPKLDSF